MSREHTVRARKRAPVGRSICITVVVAVMAAAFAGPAGAAKTTITSTVYPGNVVRDDSISFSTHPLGRMFSRTTATGNWSVTSPLVAGGGAGAAFGCFGDNGPIGTAGAGNNSPRTNLAITGAAALLNANSPVIDTSVAGLLAGF